MGPAGPIDGVHTGPEIEEEDPMAIVQKMRTELNEVKKRITK